MRKLTTNLLMKIMEHDFYETRKYRYYTAGSKIYRVPLADLDTTNVFISTEVVYEFKESEV